MIRRRRSLSRSRAATADVALAEAPLEPFFDDQSNQLRVTGPVDFAIDGNENTAWGIDEGPARRNLARRAVFVTETAVSHPEGTVLTFYLSQKHGGRYHRNQNLGRFRLSVTTASKAEADPLPTRVREILSTPPKQRTPSDSWLVFRYWRTTVPEWRWENDEIERLWRRHPEGSRQLVLEEREKKRPTHVLSRGDFLNPAQKVTPGVPSFLHPLPPDAPPNRLGLARWLVSRDSPTTARSLVNRVWQTYFGTGLVASSEDLGRQSEAASHPKLLDWLAVEFMEKGWSLKELHRLIVSSATYRQSSQVTPEGWKGDPYNRLLARGPRFRVEAEIVRDITLAASGLLNPGIGGASVYPPAPGFLFKAPSSFGPKIWKEETGKERYRRALYTFRYRSVPIPCYKPSTRPMKTPPVFGALGPTHPSRL